MHVIFDDENIIFLSVFGLLVLFGRSYELTAVDLNGPDLHKASC